MAWGSATQCRSAGPRPRPLGRPSNVVKAGMRQTRGRDGREDRSPSQDLGRFEWSKTPDLRTQGPSTGAALSVLTLPPRSC